MTTPEQQARQRIDAMLQVEILAEEIAEALHSALEQIEGILGDLESEA